MDTFFDLDTERVGQIVDSTVTLIQRLSKVIGPEFGDVSLWLHRRDSMGRFSNVVFL